jgi:sugar lactone lactonase YvrE
MRRLIVAVCLVTGISGPPAVSCMAIAEFQDGYRAAQQALASGHYQEARRGVERLLANVPRHPGLELLLARSAAAAGRSNQAFAAYRQLVIQGFGALVATDPPFKQLRSHSGWTKVHSQAVSQSSALTPAREAFEIPDSRTIPESIAFDSRSNRFFVSSTYLRKIFVREPAGNFRDFVSSKDGGLLQALGIKVDPIRDLLWVCTGADDNRLLDASQLELGRSGILGFSLATGQLRFGKWTDDRDPHLFNDLVQGPDGSIYITDSDAGRIYRLKVPTAELQAVTSKDSLLYPNGITIDSEGRYLFVADVAGIARIDLNTFEIQRLTEPNSVSAAGIDGLYYYGRELIGVQSDVGLNRVMAFALNSASSAITGARVLERGDPRMSEPTEGVLVGSSLYFVASSQQSKFSADGTPITARLHASSVLELRLGD